MSRPSFFSSVAQESGQRRAVYTDFMPDPQRDFLRHAVATIAYRGGKAIRNAPASFAGFDGAGKTPAQILAHIGDLLDWSLRMAQGSHEWRASAAVPWDQETARFFAALVALDAFLASSDPIQAPVEKLFQGPVADALTHVGQLAMMRRMAGSPMRSENYYVANIQAGRVGADQASAAKEF
jgi:hypothetical protein